MARISHKKWGAYANARGASKEMSKEDIKKMAYDTLFEVSNSWGSAFGQSLREAVYCKWYDTARQMLEVQKNSTSKVRALTIINDLENLNKED